MSVLQRDFEQHLKSVHPDEYAKMQKIPSGLSAAQRAGLAGMSLIDVTSTER